MIQVSPFLVAECLAVRDEELQIAGIGAIHIGIVDLIDDPMAKSEPNPASSVVSGADALFGRASPSRLDARSAESQIIMRRIHKRTGV